MRTRHLFYPRANDCSLFGRKGDMQCAQKAAFDAFPVQVPATAHIRDWSASHVVEEHLPGVICVFWEQVLLRVYYCVRWLPLVSGARSASSRSRGSIRLCGGAASEPHPILQEVTGGEDKGYIL
ncbi:hypothetical protein MHU86_2007 [Fragilaria crotonensis]|nr:hypothetical protein MHU86_2007 [Fragilaria crotonensis]